jgi:hypothetical protein
MEIKLWHLLLGVPYIIWTICSIYVMITQWKDVGKCYHGSCWVDSEEITPFTNVWCTIHIILLIITMICVIWHFSSKTILTL